MRLGAFLRRFLRASRHHAHAKGVVEGVVTGTLAFSEKSIGKLLSLSIQFSS